MARRSNFRTGLEGKRVESAEDDELETEDWEEEADLDVDAELDEVSLEELADEEDRDDDEIESFESAEFIHLEERPDVDELDDEEDEDDEDEAEDEEEIEDLVLDEADEQDVDADRPQAEITTGEETPGGSVGDPDQDRIDDIGSAAGVVYNDDEPLDFAKKIGERDREHWELDPDPAVDQPEEWHPHPKSAKRAKQPANRRKADAATKSAMTSSAKRATKPFQYMGVTEARGNEVTVLSAPPTSDEEASNVFDPGRDMTPG
jgi:hypothetical protein